jgi:hypothetical protein
VLYAFGFERIGVVVGDLYFVNPRPEPRNEGPEQGVRLEVRLFERGPARGSVYSAQAIAVDRPLWRVDLLEAVDRPGTLDRAHHHPRFDGWEPGARHFVAGLTADPLGWLHGRLSAFGEVLTQAGVAADEVGPGDVAAVSGAAGDLVATARRLLAAVRASAIGSTLPATSSTGVRVGWL